MPIKSVLLDTNIVSYFYRNDTRMADYGPFILKKNLIISFMTLAEIRFGITNNNWGISRVLEMETYIQLNFTVHYPTDEIVSHYARCMNLSHKRGKPMSHGDAWIAATALELECPLVTHNAKDYEVLAGELEILTKS